MSRAELVMPWLPPGEIVAIEGRGEFFVRHHRHPDPEAPTIVLMHGWTATADLQFFPAYGPLAERFSVVALDHQGHGRGLRTPQRFTIEEVADDTYLVARRLGIERAVFVGYSMGGPLTLTLARRHPGFVRAMVLQATALEFRATRRERLRWRLLPLLGWAMRSWAYPRVLRRATHGVLPDAHPLAPYRAWMDAETMRAHPFTIVDAGRAIAAFDARPWAAALGVPAACLITTSDHLVRPRKQRALAAALGATVAELPADHFSTITQPERYTSLTVELIEKLLVVSS